MTRRNSSDHSRLLMVVSETDRAERGRGTHQPGWRQG